MDIREGDLLIVGGIEYPVRSVSEWSSSAIANTKSFRKLATIDASTKRSPAIVSGKRGVPSVNLSNLKCTPLDPVSPEVRPRLGLDTPHELLETMLADDSGFVHLILEELKR